MAASNGLSAPSAKTSTATNPLHSLTQPASAGLNLKFYAVRVGKAPGIYHSWADCLDQVRGYPNASFKSFASLTDAEAFLSNGSAARNGSQSGNNGKFYAVREGRVPGVYGSWAEVLEQITGWRAPKHKVFDSRAEAELFVKEGRNAAQQPLPMVMNGDTGRSDSPDGPKSKKAKTVRKTGVEEVLIDGGNEYEPGTAPLADDVEDDFESGITLDRITGTARYKTAAELSKTRYQAVGPAPNAPIRIYTDGSTLSNGRVDSIGGVGVYFGPKDRRNISEPLSGSKQTNQRAELTAILRALEVAPRDRRIVILSDSNYAIKCVTEWYQKWRGNNWVNSAGRPVENRDLTQKVLDMLDERMRLNKHRMAKEDWDGVGSGLGGKGPWERGPAGVQFTWVKGHAKDEGNEAADELATSGARTARELAEEVVLD
ncbi:ribonuclease H [Neohortaea acidophila]|uniref:Ribonuclease H n=1 Tax=Neohortaea acidophila TaxID=245834 RepID=A0A6A6PFU9_9PEZI|nr:ribonuclease H [Neohortaea acidophila]KAF2478850.1 ribonuclease H [Neohortaea acidophila]